MPKVLEKKLREEATKKGLTGEHFDAYVYGGMRKSGWIPSTQKSFTQGRPK